MIRPFISSPGRCITETTDSLVCSTATRWMASVTILRARLSASAFASFSMFLHRDRGLALGLVLHGRDELVLGVVRGQPGDPLKLFLAFAAASSRAVVAVVEVLPAPVERLPALFHAAALGVEALFPLADPQLAAFQVAAELAHLVLDGADLVLDLTAVLRGLFGPLGRTLDTLPPRSMPVPDVRRPRRGP